MVDFTNVVVALLVSVIGVGYTSYKIGFKAGITETVNHFIDEGILKVEEEDSDES